MSATCTVGGPNVRLAARIVDDRLMRCATMSSCRQAVISRECKATLISSRVRSKCPEREREREREKGGSWLSQQRFSSTLYRRCGAPCMLRLSHYMQSLQLAAPKQTVTTTTRFRFDCRSTAVRVRPFDNLRYDP